MHRWNDLLFAFSYFLVRCEFTSRAKGWTLTNTMCIQLESGALIFPLGRALERTGKEADHKGTADFNQLTADCVLSRRIDSICGLALTAYWVWSWTAWKCWTLFVGDSSRGPTRDSPLFGVGKQFRESLRNFNFSILRDVEWAMTRWRIMRERSANYAFIAPEI